MPTFLFLLLPHDEEDDDDDDDDDLAAEISISSLCVVQQAINEMRKRIAQAN